MIQHGEMAAKAVPAANTPAWGRYFVYIYVETHPGIVPGNETMWHDLNYLLLLNLSASKTVHTDVSMKSVCWKWQRPLHLPAMF